MAKNKFTNWRRQGPAAHAQIIEELLKKNEELENIIKSKNEEIADLKQEIYDWAEK